MGKQKEQNLHQRRSTFIMDLLDSFVGPLHSKLDSMKLTQPQSQPQQGSPDAATLNKSLEIEDSAP